MSGGSYDYAYGRVEDLAREIRGDSALRRAFRAHLVKVAKALHDIEWVDSGDCSPGDEEAAIRACLAPGAEMEAAREALRVEVERAQAVLAGFGK